jgi:hypothetical protein
VDRFGADRLIMTDRSNPPDDRSLLARLFGALGRDLAQEASFAVRDIRYAHERATYGREVSFHSERATAQQARFEELYGQSPDQDNAAAGQDMNPQSDTPGTAQQARFEDLYGRSTDQPDDTQRTPDRVPDMER